MLKSEGFSSLLTIQARAVLAAAPAPRFLPRPSSPVDPNDPLHVALLSPFLADPTTGSPTVALLRLVSDLEPCAHSLVVRSHLIPSSIATGGVYKEQGLIHRSILRQRLLAIPRSCAPSRAHSLSIAFLSSSFLLRPL